MAVLNEGATSFAAANWSDATGFADNATLEVNKPFGRITAGLDQSGLSATGIDSLDFNEGATGQVGGGTDGSLQVDANSTGTERIRNRGRVDLYLTDGGTEIQNLDLGGRQRTFLTGGTVTDLTIDGGLLNANASSVITNLYSTENAVTGSRGSGVIEYNATGFTLAHFLAGNWLIKRGFTKIIVGGTATVTLHGELGTLTEVEQWGGKVFPMYGAVPTYTLHGGLLDFSQQQEDITYGGTAFNSYGGRISGIKSGTTISNVAYLGASDVRQPVGL